MKTLAWTEDGRRVVSDVWSMHSTHGVPFEVTFALLQERESIPCWITLYKDAKLQKMKHERILNMIEGPICDVWGPEHRDVIIGNLEKVFGNENGIAAHGL